MTKKNTRKKTAKKTAKKGRKAKPKKQALSGRTEKGTFAPGSTGNPAGRPKGIDFRKVMEEAYRAKGPTALHDRIRKAGDAMFAAAEGGDVSACRFIVERLCGLLTQGHDITATTDNTHRIDPDSLRKTLTEEGVMDAVLRREVKLNGKA